MNHHQTQPTNHESLNSLPLRPPAQVMRLERLGAMHQTRLSFVRSTLRRIMHEQWRIKRTRFDLDKDGYGTCIYRIEVPTGDAAQPEIYTLVFFAQHLDDALRSDRVIAEAWDVAFGLCEGEVDEDDLANLRVNLPKQEAGRCRATVLVLSRANKSVRNFSTVVEQLAQGVQPDPAKLAQVGYLYRTTAVYGNGKFGLADYGKLQQKRTFAGPFAAQMFTVYMMRQFSVDQVNHVAQMRNSAAVPLDERLARYLGVGNSTGLGMAPFLISHPQLISQWILVREKALARVLTHGAVTEVTAARFVHWVTQAITHVSQIWTDDTRQQENNCRLVGELGELKTWFEATQPPWPQLVDQATDRWSLETQEMIVSILLELYPELVDELADQMGVEEQMALIPQMPLAEFKQLLESRYGWALSIDFAEPTTQHFFWYRSAEKEEPRLGQRALESGAEKEVQITIARDARDCYNAVLAEQDQFPESTVIDFLLRRPHLRATVRRIQSMGQTIYGDIQDNLLDVTCLPIHLLRCKLAFFGASKFDPKSALWVRITLFQGAPLISEIGQPFADDWFLPVMPLLAGSIDP